MKKVLFLSLCLVSLTLIAQIEIFACSCSLPESPAEVSEAEFKEGIKSFKGAVFEGIVIKKETAFFNAQTEEKITFKVESVWKVLKSGRVIIYTPGNETACGFPYKTGQKYLVFAMNIKGRLLTDLCGQSGIDKYREIFLSKLGEGENFLNKKSRK